MYKHEGLFGSVEVLCGLYLWAKGLVFGVCCLFLLVNWWAMCSF